MAKQKKNPSTIAENRKARHDYQLESFYEAGIILQGWEVKSLRSGKVQLRDSYVKILHNEAFLMGALINPLTTASTHVVVDPNRTRKLLLNRREINKLMGYINLQGYTVVALSLYWKKGKTKVNLGLAKGKKEHDKRQSLKERDWNRNKARILSGQVKKGST